MSAPPRASVPALSPAWLSPRRIALGAVVLLLVNGILGPLATPAGLSSVAGALPGLFSGETLRALAYMVVPAVLLGLVSVRAAMHGRSAAGAALGCLAAGGVFGVVTFAGGYALLMSMMPRYPGGYRGGEDAMMAMALPGQVMAFTLSVLGLALPVSRSHREPSCDAVPEALVVTGAWLLTAGTLVRWNGFGLSFGGWVPLSPSNWSLPCVTLGLAMVATGIAADHRLVTWLAAVRRGEEPGWRVEPLADSDAAVPSLLGSLRREELPGLVVLDRAAGPVAVARVVLGGSDVRRLVIARLRAVAVAVGLLLAVGLVVVATVVWQSRQWRP